MTRWPSMKAVLAGAVGCALVALPAHALVLCMKKSGNLAVRDVCKPRETQVDPVALGLQGPKGDMGDPGLQGPPGPSGASLVVRDANGALVGAVIDLPRGCDPSTTTCANSFVRIARDVSGTTLAFFVDRDGFVDAARLNEDFSVGANVLSNLSGRLWYPPSAPCSGQPLLEVDSSQDLVPYVRVYGTTGYYPAGSVTQRTLDYFQDSPTAACAGGTFFNVLTAPASTLDLTSFGLVPPFHVEGL